MRKGLLWSAFIPIFLAASFAAAQQVPVFTETVVVTATGEEEAAAGADASVTVITRRELEAAGAPAVAEALRRVPGVVLLRSGQDTGVGSLFVRGTGTQQSLVLLNGIRLNSPFFGGYDWSLPLAAGIERVEVVRGPFSALYGADAVGGVVHLITGQGPALRVLAEAGGGGAQRGEVESWRRVGPWSLGVAAAARAGSGELVNDDYRSRVGMVDLGRTFAAGRAGLLVRASRVFTEIPFAGATRTPRRSTEAEELLAAVPLAVDLGRAGRVELGLSAVDRTIAFRDPDDPWGFVAGDTEADSASGALTWRFGLGGHRLAAGGEWRRDVVSDASNFGPAIQDRVLVARSAFLQDKFELPGRFELLLGARWDAAEPWGSEVSPRGTLAWSGDGVRAWMSYGRAFRAPTLGELYYPFGGNPGLAPERSRAAELGTAFGAGASALQLVAFTNRVSNLVDFDYAAYRYDNLARAAQDGLELSWLASLGRQELAVALTWLDARDGAGRALVRRPRWSGSATLRGRLPGYGEGEAALVWVGRRPDLDPISLARTDHAGFVTASLAARFPLPAGVAVRVRAENLADRAYEEVRGYPAPGRRLFLGVEVLR